MESRSPGNVIVSKACFVFALSLVAVSIWWNVQTGGSFDAGCGEWLSFLLLVGTLCFWGAFGGLALSVVTIKLGFPKRGWFGLICSLGLIVYFIFVCSHGVC